MLHNLRILIIIIYFNVSRPKIRLQDILTNFNHSTLMNDTYHSILKLSHVLYCILVIHYILKLYLFHNLFSCNCKEVQVDIHNKLSFQMFRISLVQTGTVCQLHYLLTVTLMHVYSYYLSCLLGY